jgi:hypothetical protein
MPSALQQMEHDRDRQCEQAEEDNHVVDAEGHVAFACG